MARTPKAIALGRALRRERDAHGLTLNKLATEINRDTPTVSRWENGQRVPKPELVARILATLGVDGERHDQLMTLAYDVDRPQWFAGTEAERREQVEAFLELERRATSIVQVSPLVLPGLLQIPSVVRDLTIARGGTDAAVEAKLDRQRVLTRSSPAKFTALIGLPSLYHHIGGVGVTVQQLEHLTTMSLRSHIEVLITPANVGWHPGLEGGFTLIETTRTGPVVFIQTRLASLWLHRTEDVARYQRDIGVIRQLSLTRDSSLRLITTMAHHLRSTEQIPRAS
ncbi:helix-turn-helix domain-containing protein [Actinokineospora inagensis]|uniref:helix-turn-helix domain-containing protein n=1 Tax=Actinokineospora inagensis TaxID=103730 RepID=UPI000411F1C3|nr:helix-turn-helix transcriptional regulator [Actinokineospora inagensis]